MINMYVFIVVHGILSTKTAKIKGRINELQLELLKKLGASSNFWNYSYQKRFL